MKDKREKREKEIETRERDMPRSHTWHITHSE